ncbi:MAG: hypothetical protein AAFY15_00600 [Cyanobacteria bacterium J06648_11]
MRTITLSDGTATLTFAIAARIAYGAFYYSQDFNFRSGRRTALQSGPFVQGQIWTLSAWISDSQRPQLELWHRDNVELTVVDSVDDSEFTATIKRPIRDAERCYHSLAYPHDDATVEGWYQQFDADLFVETVTRYLGTTTMPFLEVV